MRSDGRRTLADGFGACQGCPHAPKGARRSAGLVHPPSAELRAEKATRRLDEEFSALRATMIADH